MAIPEEPACPKAFSYSNNHLRNEPSMLGTDSAAAEGASSLPSSGVFPTSWKVSVVTAASD